MNTATGTIDNTEVRDMNQIHGEQPYQFARHELYAASAPAIIGNTTNSYTRRAIVESDKQNVKPFVSMRDVEPVAPQKKLRKAVTA